MVETLDKDPAASTLFNSARQTCEEYMIIFIDVPLKSMLNVQVQMSKKNNILLNNQLN